MMDTVAESSEDGMFLKVRCGLDTSFASHLVQDDEITVLQIPDLKNLFLVYVPIDVAPRAFFQSYLA